MDAVSYNKKHNEANGENNRDGEEHNLSWNCGAENKARGQSNSATRQRPVVVAATPPLSSLSLGHTTLATHGCLIITDHNPRLAIRLSVSVSAQDEGPSSDPGVIELRARQIRNMMSALVLSLVRMCN